MFVKIDNDIFDIEVEESSVQLSTGSHATIYLRFDIKNHKEYLSHFTKMFEEQKKSLIKFNTLTNKFEAIGCIIKSIDTDFKSVLNLTLRCDLLNLRDLQARRDEIIEDIMNKDQTSDKQNNIN